MIPIDTNTVAVQTEADLISAVADNAINYIYLANDIVITGGITILASKTSLVFDGEYPQGTGVRNQFTDVDNTDYLDTLGIRSSSSITLTFRNMIINGRNYFGVPYIIESLALIRNTNNVSVIYENVKYTGPQMTYNCNGFTRYTNCDITIDQNGSVLPQEVGEINRVEFGGRTSIVHNSQSVNDDYAVLWFRGDSATMSLTILTGAQVTINSANSYFMYNMDPFFFTPYPVPYVIQPGASFTLMVRRGLSFDSRNQVSSFLVDENASFRYIQTGNNGTSVSLYLNGSLAIRQGARFYMQAASSAQPLIQFTSGTGRSLTVSNPFSFVLYCASHAALISLATTQFNLQGGQLNTWSIPTLPVESAGGFEDIPEWKWFKKDYANPVVFTGSLTQTVTTATGNLTDEDLPHPADTDLHLHTARVISIGDWPVLVNPVEDNGTPITGQTEPGAHMRAIYTIDDITHTINGTAEEDGLFSLETSEEDPIYVPAGTEVAIWSNIPFLIKEMLVTAIQVGSLLIVSAPEVIVFTMPPISINPAILPRVNPEDPVVINDTRTEKTRWELFASITGPLQTEFGDTLPDAVIFMETPGGELITLSDTPIVVRTQESTGSETEVFWPLGAGILIRVTAPIRVGTKYYTRVNWEIHALEML